MRRLEDIPKKQIFTVPDGYFDQLPVKIQSRTAKTRWFTFSPGFRIAAACSLPAMVLVFVLIGDYSSKGEVESILASVETADMIQYLQESDLTTYDVIDNIEFNNAELNALETEVYQLNTEGIEEEFFDLELNEF